MKLLSGTFNSFTRIGHRLEVMTVPLLETTETKGYSKPASPRPLEHGEDEKDILIAIPGSKLQTEKVEVPTTNQAITLERKSNIKRTLVFIAAYISMEICKHLSTFALSKSYQNQFPVPSTVIQVLTETTKLLLILISMVISNDDITKVKPSYKFSIPAALYFVTNFLYLYAMKHTSPPLWMVLIQARTIYTSLAYKVVFGREVTGAQMAGCLLIVISIPIAHLSSLKGGDNSINFTVLLMSQLAAFLATVACISVELLLKNDGRRFQEQQMWLYSWGILFAVIGANLQNEPSEILNSLQDLLLQDNWILLLMSVTVFSTAIGGLCVPIIVKNLDSIVKDYTAAMNNILLAVLTAFLFPQDFSLSVAYVISLMILLSGIYLYEKKKLGCCRL